MSCYRLVALCSIDCLVYCQESSSLAVETYLLRPIGARTAGMSNMHVACADDPTALFSNPTSIGYLRYCTMITTSTTLLSFGRSLSNIALSHPISLGVDYRCWHRKYDRRNTYTTRSERHNCRHSNNRAGF